MDERYMGRTQVIGNIGERLARGFLENKGYLFLEANWRCKAGEIDLVMQEGETRVFVEVRFRKDTTYGLSSETVAYQKQRKLIKAMQWYQQEKDWWGEVRFDVIAIDRKSGNMNIEHIEGAIEQ